VSKACSNPEDVNWLRSQIAALEQLLEVHEQTALEQAGRLEQALEEVRRQAEQRSQAEKEQIRLGEEIIRMQEALLAELSTPLIPISDQVMVMPLIGMIDSRRAERMINALLKGIEASQARVTIVDITGVPDIDPYVADALIKAAKAVQLIGAELVLTGIRPAVAQGLVQAGVDLRAVVTYGDLQTGIAHAAGRVRSS
jgi:anti-anti-sigma regulatory factor